MTKVIKQPITKNSQQNQAPDTDKTSESLNTLDGFLNIDTMRQVLRHDKQEEKEED